MAVAWVLGFSALLIVRDTATTSWAAPVVFLGLALPLCAWHAWLAGRAVVAAAHLPERRTW